MIITVAAFKGGVGKTTSAVHLASFLQEHKPTLLVDGDLNRSATNRSKRGSLPFTVVDERQAAKYSRDFEHIVIDTEARPEEEDLKALAEGADLLIIPTTPDALSLDALRQTVKALKTLGSDRFRILITMVPPKPSRDGEEARAMLTGAGLPVFESQIRRLAAFQKAALAGVPVSVVPAPRAKEGWATTTKLGRRYSVAAKPSKFHGFFQADVELVVEKTPLQSIAPVAEPETIAEPLTVPGELAPEQESLPNRRTGRPATGKKSDPNYRQVTAYVRKDLYREVTDALYDESRGRKDMKRKEFSELVDELLEQWWQARNDHANPSG